MSLTKQQIHDAVELANTMDDAGYSNVAGTINLLVYDLEAATARAESAERDARIVAWMEANPDKLPYHDGQQWCSPYLVTNDGGFGGGVGESHHKTLRNAVLALIPKERT